LNEQQSKKPPTDRLSPTDKKSVGLNLSVGGKFFAFSA
jgi:hypothetical protein